jgi:hypothetical protein
MESPLSSIHLGNSYHQYHIAAPPVERIDL